jgi:hypothetical protein
MRAYPWSFFCLCEQGDALEKDLDRHCKIRLLERCAGTVRCQVVPLVIGQGRIRQALTRAVLKVVRYND